MPPYIVLARKWRPAQFADIVGQNHIVKTLMNAIRTQRIHQAYLFTGSRGVGKTSIARIFSKVVRCEKTVFEKDAIYACNQCSSCLEIAATQSVDVIEIDGASNNGVESVREIRESAKYLPTYGSRKIYIIDEVHMLTTAAFNALLKILEEPPSHIIFIFATTEPHKIPATILSRCQRFDYRRVTVTQIQNRLMEVAQTEGIQAETGAISLMARAAEGSMRDALSLLDQVIAFSGSEISIQSVRESVGLIEGQAILEILNALFLKKPLDALQIVEKLYQHGHDLRLLTRNLTEFLHATLLAKVGAPDSSALELSPEEWKEIQALSALRGIEEIELIFQVIHHGLECIARSPQPKVLLDVLLIKCATADTLIEIEAPSTAAQKAPAPTLAPILEKPPEKPPSPSSERATRSWEGFIEHVRRSRPLLASILEHSSTTHIPPLNGQVYDKALLIYFAAEKAYFREQLQTRVYQEQMVTLSKEYFGSSIRVQVEVQNESKDIGESLAARRTREHKERLDTIKDNAQKHPIILEAKNLFGGELSPITVSEPSRHV